MPAGVTGKWQLAEEMSDRCDALWGRGEGAGESPREYDFSSVLKLSVLSKPGQYMFGKAELYF